MSITWNFDIDAAKREKLVMLCVDDEKRWVGLSRWLPDEQRWNMLATTQQPYAWSEVNHPLSDTPYVKPFGVNTSAPPVVAVSLPAGVNVSLPPGVI